MKNKLWYDPKMLSKALDDTFGEESLEEAPEEAESTPRGAESIRDHGEPPACLLEEITGEYVLIFPSGRKQKYRSKSVAKEIAIYYGVENVIFTPYREIYDPTSTCSPLNKDDGLEVNVYKPPKYRNQKPRNGTNRKFPTIEALIMNVIPEKVSHDAFLNWLAVIFNTGCKTGTAWVILGSQGSGKTMLFERVLTPLLGEGNCTELNQDALSSRFNQILHRKQLVCFNEVHSSRQAAERIKTWVTEDQIRLEDKTVRASINRNFLNLIFTSNSQVPVLLEPDDRRFNVVRTGGPLTEVTWFNGSVTIQAIKSELSAFAQFLQAYPYAEADARRTIMNSEKRRLIEAGVNPLDRMVDLLRRGRKSELRMAVDSDLLDESDLSELSNLDKSLTKELVLKLAEGISGETLTMTSLTRELKSRGVGETRGRSDGSTRKREYTWQGEANLDKSDKDSE